MFVKLTSGFSMVALLSRNLVLQDCWETGSKSCKLEVTFAIHHIILIIHLSRSQGKRASHHVAKLSNSKNSLHERLSRIDRSHILQQFYFSFSARRQYHQGLGLSQNRRVSGQRLCLLFSQISISADRDVPAFSKEGTFFLLRYLKNGRKMSVV